MKSNLKVILAYGLAIAVIIGVIALVYQNFTTDQEIITEGDFVYDLTSNEVTTFNLDYNKNHLIYEVFVKDENGNYLDVNDKVVNFPKDADGNVILELPKDVELKTVQKKVSNLANIQLTDAQLRDIAQQQVDAGVGVGLLHNYKFTAATVIPWWVSLLPGVLVVVALVALYYFAMKKMMNN